MAGFGYTLVYPRLPAGEGLEDRTSLSSLALCEPWAAAWTRCVWKTLCWAPAVFLCAVCVPYMHVCAHAHVYGWKCVQMNVHIYIYVCVAAEADIGSLL